jgi:hypothetical protein
VFVAVNGNRLAFNYAGTFQSFAAGSGEVYGGFGKIASPLLAPLAPVLGGERV